MLSNPNEVEIEAHHAWEQKDHPRAFALFSTCANLGAVGCMLNLGYFYDEGIGTRADKAQAMRWYKRAYRRGSSAAASNIAILYREQRRNRECFQWFVRSAQLGDGDAEVDVAKLYLQGVGVRRSPTLAKEALARALASQRITEAGREEAAALLDALPSTAEADR